MIKEVNNFSARFFHQMLLRSPDAQHARDYMKSRGFSKETAENWLIGWAPKNSRQFFQTLKEKGFNGREILNAGLGGLREKENPRSGLWSKWYDQLTFPIYNDAGDVVGFSARVLSKDDKRGKYINTSDSVLFNKSKLLFGLDKARKHIGKAKFALICEGQVDAIVLHEAGFQNTVAPLGTAFTEQHANMLNRYTNNVVLCYDGDGAGRNAATKAFNHLAPVGLSVKLVNMPDGHDPDTFLQEFGVEKFQELLDGARDFFDAKLDLDIAETDLTSASERAELLKKLAGSVCKMSDKLLQDATIQTMATRLRLSADEFRLIVAAEKEDEEKNARFSKHRESEPTQTEQAEASPIDPTIAYLCHLSLRSNAAAVLQTILGRRPNADSAATIQAFLMTLAESDRLALEKSFTDAIPENPEKSATEAVTLLLSTHFQKKEASLRAQLAMPNLPAEEMLPMVEEIQRLQEFLKNLDSRFIR